MKPEPARQLLEQSLAELTQARKHLDYSFKQVSYCREQKPALDTICEKVSAHARHILSHLDKPSRDEQHPE